ncbi:MAG: FAD-dependent monooxygenase, partial [Bryobacteraceae bacterium]
FRVEEILRDCLASHGGRVELATELVSFEQNRESVTAILAGQNGREEIAVQYLVGADGGRSFVRQRLDVPFEGETWESERMFVGDVRLDGLDRDHWHSWLDPEFGWLGLCPLPGTDLFQLQAQLKTDDPGEPTLERFRQIVAERTGGFNLRLHDAAWLSLYRANVRMVTRYRVGRVFLAGDAAHVHSPAGGQGMNTGIQDAYNLGWKLGCALAGAPEQLLDTYEEERLPVAAETLGLTSRLHRESLSGKAGVQKRGPETLQLGIHYRGRSLAIDRRDAPGVLQAGDRAPDAPCHDEAGKPVRLFDVFRGPHFTLLAFGSGQAAAMREIEQRYTGFVRGCTILPPGEVAPGNAVIDSGGHAQSAYDVKSGTLVLVRPDGYIGLIAEERSDGPVHDYLRRFFPPSALE